MSHPIELSRRWSREKVQLLSKYLAAYVTVLKEQAWCRGYEYIDAFAGKGKHAADDDDTATVEGSPLAALRIEPPFTLYHFVERDEAALADLRSSCGQFSHRSVRFYQGDCNTILTRDICPTLPYESRKRAVAFIDPYALNVEFSTIEAVASAKTIEILMNVPIMDSNRNARRSSPELIPKEQRDRITRFWGSDHWLNEFFEESATLFGDVQVRATRSAREVGEAFRHRLQSVFPEVTAPIVIRNDRNAPLYCLIFAGHNATGAKIMSEIFNRFERLGQA